MVGHDGDPAHRFAGHLLLQPGQLPDEILRMGLTGFEKNKDVGVDVPEQMFPAALRGGQDQILQRVAQGDIRECMQGGAEAAQH